MKTYTIPVMWDCTTDVTVEAESLREAVEKATKPEIIKDLMLKSKIDEASIGINPITIDTLNKIETAEDIEYIKYLGIY